MDELIARTGIKSLDEPAKRPLLLASLLENQSSTGQINQAQEMFARDLDWSGLPRKARQRRLNGEASRHHRNRHKLQDRDVVELDQCHEDLPYGQLSLNPSPGKTHVKAQESDTENQTRSEPIIPFLNEFPDVEEFNQLISRFVHQHSPRKQDKLFIDAKMARDIKNVLSKPSDTTIESSQFRFWVRQSFTLQRVNPETAECSTLIYHKGKPVAVLEKLFEIISIHGFLSISSANS
ncbi:hypothetical protein N7456_006976 [Penicillium angulare]|uniref:Uncharacterized protein n=1 Tax=Penicillium angulare TaxID=116970 RepID=A0A9W9FIW1_9EURO|nr:hypothetical protein N7456_006976 [Penicillium angulare]